MHYFGYFTLLWQTSVSMMLAFIERYGVFACI